MVSQDLEKIGTQKKWEYSPNGIVGIEHGYIINIWEGLYQQKYLLISDLDIDEKKIYRLKTEFSEVKKKYKIGEINIEKEYILINIHDTTFDSPIERIINLIEFITGRIKYYNINENNFCCKCKNPEYQLYYFTNETTSNPYCDKCLLEIKYELEKGKEEFDKEDKKYFRGFLGSVCINIPVIILWSFLASNTSIALISTIVIFYVTNFGYKLFGGKVGRFSITTRLIAYIFTYTLWSLLTEIVLLRNHANFSIEFFSKLISGISKNEVTQRIWKGISIIGTLLWASEFLNKFKFPEIKKSINYSK
ncbi:hypothetical protein CLV96_4018 [Leptospira meyeri]|uniref:Uncharacterized protein n=1 Tax=Leptospira meyeri TaxID=29508 RepID=A0A4R8MMU8_LEPME|nr:hypothetical protein [Leptospira meyeri]EKJ86135.1 hypothetical protein LEP1GSC017_3987 [Leptospira meyeri serovar Hardjo str. Went 5]TDY65934.1 hypothetical protein CLV96_4018 [Leptospira meyeri]